MRRDHRPLTAAQQLWNLRRNPIAAGEGYAARGKLWWRMNVQPGPLARNYQLLIELEPGASPRVVVEAPDLVMLASGRKLPHVYNQAPVELCLYHPTYGEWDDAMRLDQTVVPWAYLWLYYFEDWLLTDEWSGGGEHPQLTRAGLRRLDRARLARGADVRPPRTQADPSRAAGRAPTRGRN